MHSTFQFVMAPFRCRAFVLAVLLMTRSPRLSSPPPIETEYSIWYLSSCLREKVRSRTTMIFAHCSHKTRVTREDSHSNCAQYWNTHVFDKRTWRFCSLTERLMICWYVLPIMAMSMLRRRMGTTSANTKNTAFVSTAMRVCPKSTYCGESCGKNGVLSTFWAFCLFTNAGQVHLP